MSSQRQPEIHTALKSEILRVFVRGWCRGSASRQRIVCAYLVSAAEGDELSVREIAAVTGDNFMAVHRVVTEFRGDVRHAQAEEEVCGLPLWAWAHSFRERDRG